MSVMDLHTLVDCGCIAKVYSDGSGVDIEYCNLHRSARDLLTSLEKSVHLINQLCDTVNAIDRLNGGNGRKVRNEDFTEHAFAAIRRAKGNALF